MKSERRRKLGAFVFASECDEGLSVDLDGVEEPFAIVYDESVQVRRSASETEGDRTETLTHS